MLERVVYIPRNLTGSIIDLGTFAEILLFFGKVHVHVGPGELTELVRNLKGLDNLLHLQDEGLLTVRVRPEVLAVHHNREFDIYDFGFLKLTAAETAESQESPEELVKAALRRVPIGEGVIRRRLDRFFRHGTVESVNDGLDLPKGISELARRDLSDSGYVTDVARACLDVYRYTYRPTDWYFRVQPAKIGFRIDTNLDFERLSRIASAMHGELRSFDPAHVIALVQEVRHELHRAAILDADIASSEISSRLGQLRLNSKLTTKRLTGIKQVAQFQNVALEGRSLGDAMRSGRRSVTDLLRLLERSRRFKEWLAGRPPDADLLGEYVKELSRQPWLEKLPTKLLRFGLASSASVGAGVFLGAESGAIAGVGVGAVNDFLVERLASGWRPSQFVRDEIEPFAR